MKIVKVIGYSLAIIFGVFMIVYGEADDSPGAQGLGLLAVIGGVVGLVRMRKKPYMG